MNDPNDLDDFERDAEFYYHGTGKRYHEERLNQFGYYKHDTVDGGYVFVGISKDSSVRYAKDRSKMFRDEPILLKINGDSIRDRVQVHPSINDICVNYLESDKYEIILLED